MFWDCDTYMYATVAPRISAPATKERAPGDSFKNNHAQTGVNTGSTNNSRAALKAGNVTDALSDKHVGQGDLDGPEVKEQYPIDLRQLGEGTYERRGNNKRQKIPGQQRHPDSHRYLALASASP